MRLSVFCVSLITALGLTFASGANAQPAAEPSPEARKEASEHFLRGVELFQEAAFRASLVEFERAYAISPDFRLLYNIGQVKLQLNDYLGASESYEAYLTQGGADVPEVRRKEVEKIFETLRERVGRIAVNVNLDGAEVFLDDQQVGVTPMATTVLVNVGRHRVYARSKDGANQMKVVDVAGGDVIEVKLELERVQSAGPKVVEVSPPMTKLRKIAIGAWAGAGAALMVSVATGLGAKSKVDDRDAELDKDVPSPGKARDLSDSGGALAITADVFGALAIGGAVAGAVLWIKGAADEDKPASAREASLLLGISPSKLSVGGHF